MARSRSVLVTGGARGIGAAIVSHFALNGDDVTFIDRDAESGSSLSGQLRDSLGKSVKFIEADFTDTVEMISLARQAVSSDRGIDILVNNVGYAQKLSFADIPLPELRKIMAVNVEGAFALSQAVSSHMTAQGFGRIVNIGSATIAGIQPDFAPYVMTKGALLGMTRALARELGPQGITVNQINPGAIQTELEVSVWGDGHEAFNAEILARQSIKRRVTADDVAKLCLFLSSNDSGALNGQSIFLDGGWTMQ